MAKTVTHRPHKFVTDERPDGYDAQKHVGRRPAVATKAREHNRRARHQARTNVQGEQYDQLARTGSGRHAGVWDVY